MEVMTDLAPRPPKRGGAHASARTRSTQRPDAPSAAAPSRRNPLVIRGAVVVLCFGLVVTGWAIWRHTVEAAYAERGVTTFGTRVGADVIYTDLEGRSYQVAYMDLFPPRRALLASAVPIEFLADDPETVRYDEGPNDMVFEYLLAGLVVGFGLFGLDLGTYYGTPVDPSTSRQA